MLPRLLKPSLFWIAVVLVTVVGYSSVRLLLPIDRMVSIKVRPLGVAQDAPVFPTIGKRTGSPAEPPDSLSPGPFAQMKSVVDAVTASAAKLEYHPCDQALKNDFLKASHAYLEARYNAHCADARCWTMRPGTNAHHEPWRKSGLGAQAEARIEEMRQAGFVTKKELKSPRVHQLTIDELFDDQNGADLNEIANNATRREQSCQRQRKRG